MRIEPIWTYRDAEHFALHATNEYGELDTSMIRQLSDNAWWSGVRYGVAGAFMPAVFLLLIIRYWP